MRKIYFISALITTILVSFDSFGAMIIGAALPMSYDPTKLVQNEDGSYTYNYNDSVLYIEVTIYHSTFVRH